MPRFGFAYALTPKTVIRGGYGIFYTRAEGNIIFSQFNVPPIPQISQFENGNLANPAGGSTLASPLANINSLNPKLVNGYAQQFSLSVQRQVSHGIVAEVAYVGNLGRDLLARRISTRFHSPLSRRMPNCPPRSRRRKPPCGRIWVTRRSSNTIATQP